MRVIEHNPVPEFGPYFMLPARFRNQTGCRLLHNSHTPAPVPQNFKEHPPPVLRVAQDGPPPTLPFWHIRRRNQAPNIKNQHELPTIIPQPSTNSARLGTRASRLTEK